MFLDVIRSTMVLFQVDACVNQSSPHGDKGNHRAVRIRSQTDGMEARQFLHVTDAASAIGGILQTSLARGSRGLPTIMEVSSGRWMTLRELAAVLRETAVSFPHALLPPLLCHRWRLLPLLRCEQKGFGLDCRVEFPEFMPSKIRWRRSPSPESDFSRITVIAPSRCFSLFSLCLECNLLFFFFVLFCVG